MLDDQAKREILSNAKTIAVVGHSDKPARTSYQIAQYLRRAGYTVYAVNPSVEEIDGERSYASLKDIPHHIDIVDVFRRAEHLPGIVEQAIEVEAGVVWAQLGVANQEAAKRAHEAGMPIIQDTCIKVEHARLLG